MRITVWNENMHETRGDAVVREHYPEGIHGAIAGGLAGHFGSADEEDIAVELLGSTGGVRLFVRDYATYDTIRIYSDVAGVPAVTAPAVHVPAGHHLAVIEGFVATVRSGSWADSYGEYALHRSRVIDAVYRSAAEHREVEVA